MLFLQRRRTERCDAQQRRNMRHIRPWRQLYSSSPRSTAAAVVLVLAHHPSCRRCRGRAATQSTATAAAAATAHQPLLLLLQLRSIGHLHDV